MSRGAIEVEAILPWTYHQIPLPPVRVDAFMVFKGWEDTATSGKLQDRQVHDTPQAVPARVHYIEITHRLQAQPLLILPHAP